MRKSTKIVATALAGVVSMGTLAACGGMSEEERKNLSDKTVLNICMPDLGYGTDWLKGVAKGFTAKTGTKVYIKETPNESGYVAAMRAGEAPFDIYILRSDAFSLVSSNAANFTGHEQILANLDDLYNSQVGNETNAKGEPLLFKDKMEDVYEIYNRTYRNAQEEEAGIYHYYGVQWCDSLLSIVRNNKVWKDEWVVPNTTDELLALSKTIKNTKGYTPFIWSSQASYWWSVANLWVSQYQGLEDMFGDQGFWAGYSENGQKNTPDMWKRQGLLEAMKVLDELVKEENGYQHILSTQVDFTTAQGYFLLEENKIAMMANGDWLYNEMKENYPSADIEMMKTPVISAIRNLPECQETIRDKNDGIETDAELSALITAIDAGSTALTGEGYFVSQAAFDKVYEARNMYTCSSNVNHIMVSPVDSDSLDIVKAFYNYLATDEGQIKFATGGAGFTHVFETSEEVRAQCLTAANDFVKSSEAIKVNRQVAPWPMLKSRLFTMGGMPVYPMIELGYQVPELIFSLSGEGYMDATEVWVANYTNAKAKWSTFLSSAGLL